MGINQAHEQNNRAVKVDGGAVGIMDNERALLDWALSGPYIAEMVCEFTNAWPSNHNDDTKSFKKEFHSKQIKLIEIFKHFENPFSDPPEELMNIISKELMSERLLVLLGVLFKLAKTSTTLLQKKG